MDGRGAPPRNRFYRGTPVMMSLGPADLLGGFSADPHHTAWPAAGGIAYACEDARGHDERNNGPKLPFFDFLGVGAT